jgi:phosphomannomutase
MMKATVSGIRGVVGEDLGLREVAAFCGNFAHMMRGGACVLGRDTRPSGEAMARGAAAALAAGGMDVMDMGVAPTPAVFFEARRRGAGVVVTSSHNPVSWNGLKFVNRGRGADHAMMRRIVDGGDSIPPRCGSRTVISSGYVEEAAGVIGSVDGAPSVLVDAGGGAAAGMAPRLLRAIGCRVDVMGNDTPRPDPTAGGLEALAAGSATCDMGVAFDMDGDRMVLAVDGAVQPPDATLGLGVAAAMERGHRDFVLSVDTSVLVERYVKERGGTVRRCPVGEANVVGAMAECGAGAGGEGSSGGFILGEFNWCRDGMLAAGLLACMVPGGGMRRALREVTGSAIVRERVRGGASAMAGVLERVEDISSEVDCADGVRGIIDEDTWVLVRVSNTEDIVRVSAEAADMERCREVVRQVSEMVRGHV